jgi:hypothetical protein
LIEPGRREDVDESLDDAERFCVARSESSASFDEFRESVREVDDFGDDELLVVRRVGASERIIFGGH